MSRVEMNLPAVALLQKSEMSHFFLKTVRASHTTVCDCGERAEGRRASILRFDAPAVNVRSISDQILGEKMTFFG